MRVTLETKTRTRKRILQGAKRLFERKGFAGATARDIAGAARIASGTLFNYFINKEHLALTILGEALEEARADFLRDIRGGESLEELLFAHAAVGLRHVRPYRGYVWEVLESSLSPLSRSREDNPGDEVRLRHLETVQELYAGHPDSRAGELSLVELHLYWTLYLGVIAFWAADESSGQEDTLSLLDQSMRMFVAALTSNTRNQEIGHDA